MHDQSGSLRFEVLALVARIAAIVLVVEAAIMLGVELTEDLLAIPRWGAHVLIDAAGLTLICTPLIYAWVIRPYVARRDRAENFVRQVEAELRVRNERFDAALDNMHHGLAMFDGEQRIVVTNDRYAEIYGLTPEQVKPGTTLRQIVEHRIAKGLYAGAHPKEYIKERLAPVNEASTAIQRLSDGRAISICRKPMAGGGWVTTHEDITERQKLSAELEQKNALLEQSEEALAARNVQLDAALRNMSHGLCMCDTEERVVIANDRFAEMYGLSPEQLKAGMTFRQVVEQGKTCGSCGDMSLCRTCKNCDEDTDQSAVGIDGPNGIGPTRIVELGDGLIIAISSQKLENGGWVCVHQDITEQRRSEAKIAHMARHDALTGLANRVLFHERLEQALPRAKRGEMLAIHLLDLDRFKNVNDTLGHSAGDKLLKTVADRLHALVRETDTIARTGGDEFAIIQVTIAQPADATSLAERIIEVVSEPYDIDGHRIIVGTSVGIAIAPMDGVGADQLMRNADLALYRAKGDGRSTFRFFEPKMDAQMQARRTLEYDLRKAFVTGEFELFYQPVVNLERNQISGCEALIRWRHPEKGMVLPGEFIPLAEEIGLIVPLGEWAIRQACATAATWPHHVGVSVNLSAAQFRYPGLVQVVVGALAASGLPGGRLELEITETTLLEDSEATLATLHQLRELGVHIAIDDFGAGYSSLKYLQSFLFDKIKIDRSFIKDIAAGASSLNIVRAVATLANGLGMVTTAEGVETQEQLEMVRSEGCTEMQGFLFCRPQPAHEIEQLFVEKGEETKRKRASAA